MIIYNKKIPTKGFVAMAQFPFIFVREEHKDKFTKEVERHEKTHYEQQKELALLLFDAWYIIEWVIRLFGKGKAYKNICFEKEAKSNQHNPNYLNSRKRYSFLKYL